MPWKASDSAEYKKGLTSAQAKKWAKIANHVLRTCMKDTGDEKKCAGMAIRIANDKCVQTKRIIK